jgi:hypothetical protein
MVMVEMPLMLPVEEVQEFPELATLLDFAVACWES